jgi:hypothetical protein
MMILISIGRIWKKKSERIELVDDKNSAKVINIR